MTGFHFVEPGVKLFSRARQPPCAEIRLPVGRRLPAVGLPASTVAGFPALLASNPLPYGKRARWPVMPRESRAHWAGSRKQASLHFSAWREQASRLSTSPDTDRSRVATLCTLLLAILFPAVLPSDNPGASASRGSSCKDQ